MENIKLNTFFQNSFFSQAKPSPLVRNFTLLIFMGLFLGGDAMAASGGGAGTAATGLCQIATWLKEIVTGAAIIAVMIFVTNSFFIKSSVVGDIIMYVIIGCAIASVATYIITQAGLTSSCSM